MNNFDRVTVTDSVSRVCPYTGSNLKIHLFSVEHPFRVRNKVTHHIGVVQDESRQDSWYWTIHDGGQKYIKGVWKKKFLK
jgi:hypothetical protein